MSSSRAARWDAEGLMRLTQQATGRPERARVLVLAPDDSAIIVIGRHRPGRAPYCVLPGGGLEPEDADPFAGALRELREETGVASGEIDRLTERVIPVGDEWIHLARARRRASLILGGPERYRDAAVHGSYEPIWLAADEAMIQVLHPAVVRVTR